MEARNGFFSESVEEAMGLIAQRTGRRVAEAGIGTAGGKATYLVTDDGRVFVAMKMHGRIAAQEKKPVRNGRSTRWSVYTYGKRYYDVAQCVYCAFVLGRWDDVRPKFKDGNPRNCSVENLSVDEGQAMGIGYFMRRHADVYEKEFGVMVDYLRFRYFLRKEEAEDVVQDVFIYLSGKAGVRDDFGSLWMYYCKHKCGELCGRKMRHEKFEDWKAFGKDEMFEFPVPGMLENTEERDIIQAQLDGYEDRKELADRLGITKNQLSGRRQSAIKRLKRLLRADVYYERHRCDVV